MKNPPKKPQVPAGKQAVWVKRATWTRVFKKGGKRRIVSYSRSAHWRIVPVSVKAQRAREKHSAWIPARALQAELQNEYDLANSDPIYRYHPDTDVVRSLSEASTDPFHGIVWGQPFGHDVYPGRIKAVRVWYIVRDKRTDTRYMYGRTADLGEKRLVRSLAAAQAYVEALRKEIRRVYSEDPNDYLEVERFAAWTVYGPGRERSGKHRKWRTYSKRKGYTFDVQLFKLRRTMTPWEKEWIRARLRLEGQYMPEVLSRSYGGSPKKFMAAMARLSPKARKRANEYLRDAMAEREAAMDKARRGGWKPPKEKKP